MIVGHRGTWWGRQRKRRRGHGLHTHSDAPDRLQRRGRRRGWSPEAGSRPTVRL